VDEYRKKDDRGKRTRTAIWGRLGDEGWVYHATAPLGEKLDRIKPSVKT